MKILIINGPNLNFTGIRDTANYGKLSLSDICNILLEDAASTDDCTLEFFQSNHEGEIIDKLQYAHSEVDGVIINAGAFTHYSYAIADAIESIRPPVVEVHMSNIYKREEFRHTSVLAAVCVGQITGFGHTSYLLALAAMRQILKTSV